MCSGMRQHNGNKNHAELGHQMVPVAEDGGNHVRDGECAMGQQTFDCFGKPDTSCNLGSGTGAPACWVNGQRGRAVEGGRGRV